MRIWQAKAAAALQERELQEARQRFYQRQGLESVQVLGCIGLFAEQITDLVHVRRCLLKASRSMSSRARLTSATHSTSLAGVR